MEQKRTIETYFIKKSNELPRLEKIKALARDTELQLVFNKDNICIMEEAHHYFIKHLDGFQVIPHSIEPIINIIKPITLEEIIENKDFFLKCAQDYKKLASKLIHELSRYLKINLAPDPFVALKHLKSSPNKVKGSLNGWNYKIHGFHCGFKHTTSGQEIDVSLINKMNFGALDPFFYSRFIISTVEYHPLPLPIFDTYLEGKLILETLEKSNNLIRIDSIIPGRTDLSVY